MNPMARDWLQTAAEKAKEAEARREKRPRAAAYLDIAAARASMRAILAEGGLDTNLAGGSLAKTYWQLTGLSAFDQTKERVLGSLMRLDDLAERFAREDEKGMPYPYLEPKTVKAAKADMLQTLSFAVRTLSPEARISHVVRLDHLALSRMMDGDNCPEPHLEATQTRVRSYLSAATMAIKAAELREGDTTWAHRPLGQAWIGLRAADRTGDLAAAAGALRTLGKARTALASPHTTQAQLGEQMAEIRRSAVQVLEALGLKVPEFEPVERVVSPATHHFDFA